MKEERKVKTIYSEALRLKEELGKEKAIEFFENKIKGYGEPKNFADICKISGYETAIEIIKK